MRLSPRPHVSISLLLASITLAGCFGKYHPPPVPAQVEFHRYDLELPEDDEFDDLPEAGDTGLEEAPDEE
jgi:hypothetical protein